MAPKFQVSWCQDKVSPNPISTLCVDFTVLCGEHRMKHRLLQVPGNRGFKQALEFGLCDVCVSLTEHALTLVTFSWARNYKEV